MSSYGNVRSSGDLESHPDKPGRLSTLAITLLVLSALWCVVWFVHAFGYWEDDAYIHLEFARSLTRGQGFSFNGHIVYGDTSPMWAYLLAAFHVIIPGWIVAGKVLNALGVVFACAGAFFFGRRLTGDSLFGAAMVLLFVINPYFNYWAFSGMETITAAGLALWGATIVSDRQLTWPRFLAGCLIAGLGPVTRPEMVFLSAILGVLLLYRWINMPGSIGSKLPGFVAGLVLATAPTVAWSIYALHAFGRLVPNTNAAKRAAPHDSVVMRLVNVYALGFPVIGLAILAGIVYIVYRNVRSSKPRSSDSRASDSRASGAEKKPLLASLALLPAGGWVFIVWSCIATVFYIVNHTYVQTRYIFVSASGLLITVLAIFFLASPRLGRAVCVLTAVIALPLSLVSTWLFVHNKSVADARVTEYSLWIKNNLPPDAPVAIYSIGQVAFVSEHPLIDIGGITRPGVIPYLNDSPASVERWARAEGALYSAAGDQPEPGAVLVYSMDAPTIGWYLNPRKYREMDHLRLWKLPTTPAP